MVDTISNLSPEQIEGKKILVRVDFNVPLNQDLEITDDTRIKAAIPTINHLSSRGAKLILTSHLGRPKGKVVDSMRLNPVAKRLSDLLSKEVIKLDEAVGPVVKERIDSMQNGDIALLENIRFYPGEEANDQDFAKELAALVDLYVNDAFGTAHRAHASTAGVASYLNPSLAGFLMEKELEMLGTKLKNPERPFTAIIGGAKISSKITVLKNLVKKVDAVIIGGGMAFTFLKAQGGEIGQSICEDDQLQTAREIMSYADQFNTAIVLPEDSVCTAAEDDAGNSINIFEAFKPRSEIATSISESRKIDPKQQGMDAGPKSKASFVKMIQQSRTIVWNGPVGVFEYDAFEEGTREVANALAELTKKGGTTIIGGGDSVAALEKFGLEKSQFTHVSTGGGASLEFLEGKTLPGVACLNGFTKEDAAEGAEKSGKSFASVLGDASK